MHNKHGRLEADECEFWNFTNNIYSIERKIILPQTEQHGNPKSEESQEFTSERRREHIHQRGDPAHKYHREEGGEVDAHDEEPQMFFFVLRGKLLKHYACDSRNEHEQ